MKHYWTREEDIVAYYLFKFSGDEIWLNFNEIADCLEVTKGSLRMRVANFQALDGPGGLSKASQLSLEVYSVYKDIPKEAHLKEVQQILLKKSCQTAA